MLVTLSDGSTEPYEDEPFAQGGQGTLHLSLDKRFVIKLYHETDKSRIAALGKIIGEYNVTRTAPTDSSLKRPDPSIKDLFAWPNAIVQKPRLGVRMNNVNFQGPHRPLTWWIMPKAFKRLPPDIRGNWLDRTRVASNMARIAWKLHGSGLCHSDFSGDNFLANVAHHHIVLIDLDSLVVPGVLPPEMLGTGDYMAPEIVMGQMREDGSARPSIYTDLHSLAVLIYQLLLMRHPLKGPRQHDPDAEKDDLLALGERALYVEDPADRSNRPADPFQGAWLLGEEVEALMRRAFTGGLKNPTQRPLAAEWGDALMRMADQIIPCVNETCTGKAFVLLRDRPAVCPWCGTPVTFPKQVPILQLYYGVGQAGHYQADKGRIVGWQGRTLHRWHVQSNFSERSATKPDDRRPLAEIQYHRQRGWLLTNLALTDLRVTNGGTIQQLAINESITLEGAQQLVLGTGTSARLAMITMQKLQ
jgi:DNA-binding helix-hairpin-helix protein with protein kinase domain